MNVSAVIDRFHGVMSACASRVSAGTQKITGATLSTLCTGICSLVYNCRYIVIVNLLVLINLMLNLHLNEIEN